jgi:hypothetical protein
MLIVPMLAVVAGGGVLLWALWLPWASATITYQGKTMSMTATAWDLFTIVQYVLAAAGGVAVLCGLVLCASAMSGKRPDENFLRYVRSAGGIASGIMLWRTFFSVGFGHSSASMHNIAGTGIDITAHRGPGLFVALGGALVVLVGSMAAGSAKPAPIAVPAADNVTAYAGAYPANWYPDPHAPGRERWWDGQRWTWDTRDAAAAPAS